MLTADAASVEITTTTTGDTPATTVRELRIAAAGVTATVGGATGPSATLSNASLGLVVRTVGTGSPQLALWSSPATSASPTSPAHADCSTGWRFGYNELTDLDSTPVSLVRPAPARRPRPRRRRDLAERERRAAAGHPRHGLGRLLDRRLGPTA